jgi:hypothetical protein
LVIFRSKDLGLVNVELLKLDDGLRNLLWKVANCIGKCARAAGADGAIVVG